MLGEKKIICPNCGNEEIDTLSQHTQFHMDNGIYYKVIGVHYRCAGGKSCWHDWWDCMREKIYDFLENEKKIKQILNYEEQVIDPTQIFHEKRDKK